MKPWWSSKRVWMAVVVAAVALVAAVWPGMPFQAGQVWAVIAGAVALIASWSWREPGVLSAPDFAGVEAPGEVKDWYRSKRLWLAGLSAVVVLLNDALGWSLSLEQVIQVVSPLLAGLLGITLREPGVNAPAAPSAAPPAGGSA